MRLWPLELVKRSDFEWLSFYIFVTRADLIGYELLKRSDFGWLSFHIFCYKIRFDWLSDLIVLFLSIMMMMMMMMCTRGWHRRECGRRMVRGADGL